jgi:hypothetical protein
MPARDGCAVSRCFLRKLLDTLRSSTYLPILLLPRFNGSPMRRMLASHLPRTNTKGCSGFTCRGGSYIWASGLSLPQKSNPSITCFPRPTMFQDMITLPHPAEHTVWDLKLDHLEVNRAVCLSCSRVFISSLLTLPYFSLPLSVNRALSVMLSCKFAVPASCSK